MRNFFLMLALLAVTSMLNASTYYVDSNASTNGNGLSEQSPFKYFPTNSMLASGDIIKVKCGSYFSGIHEFTTSNLTFSAYGTGDKPEFSNSGGWTIFWLKGDNISVTGFKFYTSTYSAIEVEGDNCTIQWCWVSNVPFGACLKGNGGKVMNNTFTNLVLQPGTPGPDDDTGAIGVKFENGGNEVAYNNFINCIAPSADYGVDGGAFEFWGNMNGIKIHHNYIEGCDGLFEIGGGTIQNVEIYYNSVKNNRGIGGFHFQGTFVSAVYNFSVTNNTFYDVLGESDKEVMWFNGTAYQSEVRFINNIVYYDGFARFSSGSSFVHQNNVYYSPGGDPVGITLHSSETSGTYPGFVSSSNLHLAAGSVAIDKGQYTSYSTDLENKGIIGAPDAGCYEYGTVNDTQAPTPPTGVVASNITQSGFSLTWNASSDNVGVTAYDVYINGSWHSGVSGTTATISGLTANTTYTVRVLALDAAGNYSAQSTPIYVTTLAAALAEGTYRLKCKASGLYLNGNNVEWVSVKLASLDESWGSQKWDLEKVAGNVYRLKCNWDGLYLDGNITANTDVKMAALHTDWGSQKWTLEHVSGTEYRLQCNWGTNYLHGTSTSWGTATNKVYDGSNYQIWNLELVSASKSASITKIAEVVSENLQVYPNPVSTGFVTIRNLKEDAKSINLVNMNGAVMFTKEVNGGKEVRLSVESIAKGTYVVLVKNTGSVEQAKLIIK